MDKNRKNLIPSSDLAEFYARKIATGLSIIYTYNDQLDNNKKIIIKINQELEEVFKQIRNRLIRHEYQDLVDKYNDLNKKIYTLRPFIKKYTKDTESDERVKRWIITKHYAIYKEIVKEKECLIWECLEVLGLSGKVDIQTRRLR